VTQAGTKEPTKRICIYTAGPRNRSTHASTRQGNGSTERRGEGKRDPGGTLGHRGMGGRGCGVKGHSEGIENKWVRDSAIFRRCRVFRPGDSALSLALLFHADPQFPRPSCRPFSIPGPPCPIASRLPSFGRRGGASLVSTSVLFSRLPLTLSLPLTLPACPESAGPATRCRRTFGKASSATLPPFNGFPPQTIEAARISPSARTLARLLSLPPFLSFTSFLASVCPRISLSSVRCNPAPPRSTIPSPQC
jgi:hypothetical protein